MKRLYILKFVILASFPVLFTGCLIVRQKQVNHSDNINAQSVTNTSWEEQEIGNIESNAAFHFRYRTSSVIVPKQYSDSIRTYEKDGREVLRVESFSGTKEKVKEIFDRGYTGTVTNSTEKSKPWTVYSANSDVLKGRAFADGINGVIMTFNDAPDTFVASIQDGFEFTSASSVMKTYTNTKYKYSFVYPNNYTFFSPNNDLAAIAQSKMVRLSINIIAWDISVEVHEVSKDETFASYAKSTYGFDVENMDAVIINGLKAYVRNEKMFTQRVGIIDAKGKAVIFTYTDGSRSEDIVQAFDTIMKSFKLL